MENLKRNLIEIEKTLRLANAKIRTKPFDAEMHLIDALLKITGINLNIEHGEILKKS